MTPGRGGEGRAAGPPPRRVFRAPSGTVGVVVAAVVTVLLLADAVVRAGWFETFLLAPWLLLVLWAIHVMTFASHVSVDTGGATIQNLLRVIRLPWSRVTEISMKYQVRFALDDGSRVSAFGGPVAGRPARPAPRGDGADARREPPAIRDLELIREQWLAADPAPTGPQDVRRGWDTRSLIALVVLAVWAVGAVFISRASG